jgi:hypothetical protein
LLVGNGVLADSLAQHVTTPEVKPARIAQEGVIAAIEAEPRELVVLVADAANERGMPVVRAITARFGAEAPPILVVCAPQLAALSAQPMPAGAAVLTPRGGMIECARRIRGVLAGLRSGALAQSTLQQLADDASQPTAASLRPRAAPAQRAASLPAAAPRQRVQISASIDSAAVPAPSGSLQPTAASRAQAVSGAKDRVPPPTAAGAFGTPPAGGGSPAAVREHSRQHQPTLRGHVSKQLDDVPGSPDAAFEVKWSEPAGASSGATEIASSRGKVQSSAGFKPPQRPASLRVEGSQPSAEPAVHVDADIEIQWSEPAPASSSADDIAGSRRAPAIAAPSPAASGAPASAAALLDRMRSDATQVATARVQGRPQSSQSNDRLPVSLAAFAEGGKTVGAELRIQTAPRSSASASMPAVQPSVAGEQPRSRQISTTSTPAVQPGAANERRSRQLSTAGTPAVHPSSANEQPRSRQVSTTGTPAVRASAVAAQRPPSDEVRPSTPQLEQTAAELQPPMRRAAITSAPEFEAAVAGAEAANRLEKAHARAPRVAEVSSTAAFSAAAVAPHPTGLDAAGMPPEASGAAVTSPPTPRRVDGFESPTPISISIPARTSAEAASPGELVDASELGEELDDVASSARSSAQSFDAAFARRLRISRRQLWAAAGVLALGGSLWLAMPWLGGRKAADQTSTAALGSLQQANGAQANVAVVPGAAVPADGARAALAANAPPGAKLAPAAPPSPTPPTGSPSSAQPSASLLAASSTVSPSSAPSATAAMPPAALEPAAPAATSASAAGSAQPAAPAAGGVADPDVHSDAARDTEHAPLPQAGLAGGAQPAAASQQLSAAARGIAVGASAAHSENARGVDGVATVEGTRTNGVAGSTPALGTGLQPLAAAAVAVPASSAARSENANGVDRTPTAQAAPPTGRAGASSPLAAAPQPSAADDASAEDPEPENAGDADPALSPARVRADRFADTGLSLAKQGRFGLAEASYLKALHALPNYPRALAGLVRVHLQRNDGAEAFRWAKRLVNKQPNRARNQLLLGDAQALRGNAKAARVAWTRAARNGSVAARARLRNAKG